MYAFPKSFLGIASLSWAFNNNNKSYLKNKELNNVLSDFLGGPVDENPSASAGDMGSIPGPGRFHMLGSN